MTSLYVAAQEGKEAVVRPLIEAGADVNKTKDNNATPLYIAAQEGYETVVRALIEVGADINKAINDGRTPLVVAAHEDHETGADRGRRGHQEDDGWRLDAAVHRR